MIQFPVSTDAALPDSVEHVPGWRDNAKRRAGQCLHFSRQLFACPIDVANRPKLPAEGNRRTRLENDDSLEDDRIPQSRPKGREMSKRRFALASAPSASIEA
jgi:hypothetical protein